MENAIVQNPVAAFLGRYLYYLLLGILVLNLTQRKHIKTGPQKRQATLYLAISTLLAMAISMLVVRFALPDLLLAGVAIVLGIVGYQYRDRLFPFRLSCRECGTRLDFNRILYFDSNRCASCDGDGEPAESHPGN